VVPTPLLFDHSTIPFHYSGPYSIPLIRDTQVNLIQVICDTNVSTAAGLIHTFCSAATETIAMTTESRRMGNSSP